MIRIEHHGDVVRFDMSSRRSRLIGYSVSAYLVRGVLVDCGFPAVGHDVARLLDSNRLRGVIVTHNHEDHAGNIQLVASRGIPIAAHPAALVYARSPERLAFYRRFTWSEATPLTAPVVPFVPDDLTLIHTPGHAEDHLVVWDPDERTVFASDLFLGVRVRLAHLYEEPERLVDSLRRIVALAPLRMFDAHRGNIPRPVPALEAKIDWLVTTIGRVRALAADGTSDAAIARTVLGRTSFTDIVSRGEYSRLNLVRAICRSPRA